MCVGLICVVHVSKYHTHTHTLNRSPLGHRPWQLLLLRTLVFTLRTWRLHGQSWRLDKTDEIKKQLYIYNLRTIYIYVVQYLHVFICRILVFLCRLPSLVARMVMSSIPWPKNWLLSLLLTNQQQGVSRAFCQRRKGRPTPRAKLRPRQLLASQIIDAWTLAPIGSSRAWRVFLIRSFWLQTWYAIYIDLHARRPVNLAGGGNWHSTCNVILC